MNALTMTLVVVTSCLVSARAFADAHTKSSWQAKDAAWNGNFSETAHWDAGVPDATVSPIVDGYLFNQASDYTVFFDKPATLNYLHAGQDYNKNEPGRISLVVTNDVTVQTVDGTWTGYRPENGDSVDFSKRGLWLIGSQVEMTVRDGATLAIDSTVTDNTWYTSPVVKVADGAKMTVTNATLTLNDLTKGYSNQHLRFDITGTASAPSTVTVVDGTARLLGHDDTSDHGCPWRISEYGLLRFVNADVDIETFYDTTPSSRTATDRPGGTVRFEGTSRYLSKRRRSVSGGGAHGTYFKSGKTIFDDDSYLTNAVPEERIYTLAPTKDCIVPCEVEFRGRSHASFDGQGGVSADVRLGSESWGGEARLTFASDATSHSWGGFRVGYHLGRGEMNVTKGLVRMYGTAALSVGYAVKETAAVTGAVTVAGGSLYMHGTTSSEKLTGFIVGDGSKFNSAYQQSRIVGSLDFAGGVITNEGPLWVGVGADGVYRQSGGLYHTDSDLCLGAADGVGKFLLTGGEFLMKEYSDASTTGHGWVFVGGVSDFYMKAIGKTAMPSTYPPSTQASDGYLCVSNAIFRMYPYGEQRGVIVGSDGTGLVELQDGADMQIYRLALTNGVRSNLKFTLNGNRAPKLKVSFALDVSAGARLMVDARGYTGSESWIQLISFDKDTQQRWGSYRGVKNRDYFDTDAIETLGNVEVVPVFQKTGVRGTGLWAHVKRGFVVIFR